MTLIKSISGIRGTIGGKPGEGLSPLDIVKFTAAFGTWIQRLSKNQRSKIVLGRDARISGEMVNNLVTGTLVGLGIDVVNIGMAATPTVEIAVQEEKADGGIIITASHNPKQWNALKLLNAKGEFLSDKDGKEIILLADIGDFTFADIDTLGKITDRFNYSDLHIQKILDLHLIDTNAINRANFKVVIDCVNSVGGIAIPKLLKALGVKETIELYCEPNGQFPHNPEPLPENLTKISEVVKEKKADLGFVVDPDVDRLAIVNEDGTMFGEEYTIVSISDFVLQHTPSSTVSNLSSSRALKDVTEKYRQQYFAAAIGEVNVVKMMQDKHAVIGGEGNGGVIYPELHYGRDALVGIALFLTQLAKSGKKCSELRASYPDYVISKNKIQLNPQINVDEVLAKIKEKYKGQPVNEIDGLKIEFGNDWVHLRKSNTEPIIRIYAESNSADKANSLAQKIIMDIQTITGI